MSPPTNDWNSKALKISVTVIHHKNPANIAILISTVKRNLQHPPQITKNSKKQRNNHVLAITILSLLQNRIDIPSYPTIIVSSRKYHHCQIRLFAGDRIQIRIIIIEGVSDPLDKIHHGLFGYHAFNAGSCFGGYQRAL